MNINNEKSVIDIDSINQHGDITYSADIELLRKWAKISAIYYILHDKAYQTYHSRNSLFSIPVIILSTISGTVSFSINSFPVWFQVYMPMIIGGINLFVGILQTISEFLKINNLANSHRIASIQYDKFSRNIITELALPENERTHTNAEFLIICKNEMDKMIEQGPNLPGSYIRGIKNMLFYENTVDVNDILKYKYKKTVENFSFDNIYPISRNLNKIPSVNKLIQKPSIENESVLTNIVDIEINTDNLENIEV
jgi:hypothetical protein